MQFFIWVSGWFLGALTLGIVTSFGVRFLERPILAFGTRLLSPWSRLRPGEHGARKLRVLILGGASFIAMTSFHSLLLGALSGALVILVFWALLAWARLDLERARKAQILPLLYGLRSQIQCGVALPTALARVLQSSDSILQRQLRRKYRGFVQGSSELQPTLGLLQGTTPIQSFSLCFSILRKAHAQGLPLLGILQKLITLVDKELRLHRRIEKLTRSASAQALIAAFCPLGVGFVLYSSQPDLFANRGGVMAILLILGLVWQAAAVFFIRKLLSRAAGAQHQERARFIRFLEVLALHLKLGFDLSYAWTQSFEDLRSELPLSLQFKPAEVQGFESWLDQAARALGSEGLWLQSLAIQYRAGVPVSEFVEAMAEERQSVWDAELQSRMEELPGRLSVILLVGFFPPALLWVLGPLILEILSF